MAKVRYGADSIVVDLEKYSKDMEKWVKKGIAKTTLKIYNTAVALAPVDMGFLKESIDYKFTDGGLSSVISVGADYAIYVEYGTGIYATGPGGSRAKKIPWFYEDADGEWQMTYGQVAQPFWNPAIDAGRQTFEQYFS
ncbi:HK97-gp10 family putative phage morphogenesis protein [Staphylococcus aureus]|uniref:HK97-gp10 family putative phage morphogenesis protein n=1 Tax=Staphylococcus aureus TaxID=1280 RepID=UPI00071BFB4B|nr:HK97-gp10 family putative phage morphogenesis protein [Staphylococcus aureus]MDO6943219.1 HK97 gp10 family phage protein [Staphylococcus aureus]MDO6945919.1 HK97 gp10 family phage protein [Staphylococcus aureus]MDO6983013.1 HK97 gp10 family phage protein [Staphylococcus aureus]